MLKRLRQSIRRFIEKLAKENQNTFGNNRLNCCDLSKNSIKKS